ncbi:MerR family transcriptional regulator [Streptomyces sp. MBT53]|uniref:MerR family transcriptional regulator n=1 Tax=Streptomyces sp. MBT53 TaxID=1488384 RepID=UPI0019127608|nr:MerR family transcriptional regulator [Streptomyces sp. MBT53]MBK6013905.1 MerR family transcriptional regulator [Streptomyces sp. MBT53]
MRIGEAAAAAGTTPRALRLYEARGLLRPPPRTPSGQREYGPAELARVRVIRDLLALGLTLEDLRRRAHRLDLLARTPPPSCGNPQGEFSDVVADRLAALDTEITRLTRLRQSLAAAAGEPPAVVHLDGDAGRDGPDSSPPFTTASPRT